MEKLLKDLTQTTQAEYSHTEVDGCHIYTAEAKDANNQKHLIEWVWSDDELSESEELDHLDWDNEDNIYRITKSEKLI